LETFRLYIAGIAKRMFDRGDFCGLLEIDRAIPGKAAVISGCLTRGGGGGGLNHETALFKEPVMMYIQ
jgi:hypothetical protein